MNEEWLDIENYEGLYQVSNFGKIRSLDRKIKVNFKNINYVIKKGKLLKPGYVSTGYHMVILSKDGKIERKLVHRLVAKTFIPNTNFHPVVNHIDGNKKNNCVSNLEWCTCKHNMNEAFRIGLFDNMKKIVKEFNEKEVLQLDKNLNIVNKFKSIDEAGKFINLNPNNIGVCCRKNNRTCGGYYWRYSQGLKSLKSDNENSKQDI